MVLPNRDLGQGTTAACVDVAVAGSGNDETKLVRRSGVLNRFFLTSEQRTHAIVELMAISE